ncbi:hypothetical protein [Tomitella gaofuii]|uniref:hypothetical protein n=1 Tax=Tomitella gaofuii TaxID=2760083 RepID=UPI0015FA973C|nr:hypothetical protein [Tomitella gaofuii]
MSVGRCDSLALTADGAVAGWGLNSSAQIGPTLSVPPELSGGNDGGMPGVGSLSDALGDLPRS